MFGKLEFGMMSGQVVPAVLHVVRHAWQDGSFKTVRCHRESQCLLEYLPRACPPHEVPGALERIIIKSAPKHMDNHSSLEWNQRVAWTDDTELIRILHTKAHQSRTYAKVRTLALPIVIVPNFGD